MDGLLGEYIRKQKIILCIFSEILLKRKYINDNNIQMYIKKMRC